MSTQTFTLPDLGEGLTEAEVVRWLVAVGDVVVVDQAVVEVETAKSTVELPSPYAGTVSVLHGEAGQTFLVGGPLISVDVVGPSQPEAPTTTPAVKNPLAVEQPSRPTALQQYREEEKAGSGNVLIGYGTSDGGGGGRRRRPRKVAAMAERVPAAAGGPGVEAAAVGSTAQDAVQVQRVTSPLVRRLARDAGLSLREITATGAGGAVTRGDVVAAIADIVQQSDGASTAIPAIAGTDGTATHTLADVGCRTGLPIAQRLPISGFRKAVSFAMTRSRREIPEATVWVDVDFTELFALREELKSSGVSVPGLLAYLARFTTAALKAHPELNGEVDLERNELVQYDGINLGLAMQTDRGLLVPAVSRADRLTTLELDTELRRLMDAARNGRATQAELTCGTFTLNNYGAFNVDGSAAIINYPQVAILGFGRIIDRPWVLNGQIVARKIGQMSFVFDHRVCDGGVAAGFMRIVADSIETPAHAINHL